MELNLEGEEKGTLKHSMKTEHGDSGSPLIVQPKGMDGQWYVIGIHCSGKYERQGFKFGNDNTAVRINKPVV